MASASPVTGALFPFDTHSELGALIHLEHVNLRVPDQALSTLFYVEALGFTRDPYRRVGLRNMWINFGRCQFHLPTGDPEPLGGEIGVMHPQPKMVEKRLQNDLALLAAGCKPSWREADKTLCVQDPWGRVLVLHIAPAASLAYVRFWVPAQALSNIARFYTRIFYCPVITKEDAVHVAVGPQQQLIFQAHEGAVLNAASNHIALYLTLHQRIHQRLKRLELVTPFQDAQFRIYQIACPSTGQVLGQLEHELRSVHHPDFLQPLLNRSPG